MEKINEVPLYKRFSFQVLFFLGILLVGVIVPIQWLQNMDYKTHLDRLNYQRILFHEIVDHLQENPVWKWPIIIEDIPMLLNNQRILIFNQDNEIILDTGNTGDYFVNQKFDLIFPHPYIDWRSINEDFDPEILVDYLQQIDIVNNVLQRNNFTRTQSIQYDEGLDRINIFARKIFTTGSTTYIMVLSSSIVDLLIYNRSLKERFLIFYVILASIFFIFSLVLTRTVLNPLRKLNSYSKKVIQLQASTVEVPKISSSSEIGTICQLVQNLMADQKKQSENFRNFSTDIVHELKTPLSAIRSGLEVYAEINDSKGKEKIFQRIQKRIHQMEQIMNEIQDLGNLEAQIEAERSGDLLKIVDDISHEYEDFGFIIDVHDDLKNISLSLSSQKIYQVISNLLENALSYSPEKGSVALTIFLQDNFVGIQVTDKGPGIASEIKDHIADRFYSYREKDKEKHSGLGLSIIKAILTSCNGTLRYSNLNEGGAKFICTIPIAKR